MHLYAMPMLLRAYESRAHNLSHVAALSD